MPFPGNTSSEGKQPTPAPLIGTASAGINSASVPFTPSSWPGKETVLYYATSSPGGIQGTNTTTPISITGLTAGQPYTFVVNGITNYGVSSDTSGSSNSVTPIAPPPVAPPPVVPPPVAPPVAPPPVVPPPTVPPPVVPPVAPPPVVPPPVVPPPVVPPPVVPPPVVPPPVVPPPVVPPPVVPPPVVPPPVVPPPVVPPPAVAQGQKCTSQNIVNGICAAGCLNICGGGTGALCSPYAGC